MLVYFLGIVSCQVLTRVHDEKSFLSWMRRSNQFYVGDEYQLRFGIWLGNQRLVQEFNKQGKTFKVSMNKFAAYTPAESSVVCAYWGSDNKSNLAAVVMMCAT